MGELRASKWDHDEDEPAVEPATSPPSPLTTNVVGRRHRSTRSGPTPATTAKRPTPPAAGDAGTRGSRSSSSGSAAKPRPELDRPAESLASQLPDVNLPRPTLTPRRGDGSGFAFGVVLYAIGANYFRHGWPGVTGWFAAKFLNRPLEKS